MHASLKPHLDVVNRIVRHLKWTPGKWPLFEKGGELKLEIYIDDDWVGSMIDRRLTIKYCNFLGGN